jgi:hypothetical protein
MVFLSGFPPFAFTGHSNFRNSKRLHEFEEVKSPGKAVEVTVKSKEENS